MLSNRSLGRDVIKHFTKLQKKKKKLVTVQEHYIQHYVEHSQTRYVQIRWASRDTRILSYTWYIHIYSFSSIYYDNIYFLKILL